MTVNERNNKAVKIEEGEEVVVAKRQWQVPYWDLSGVNVDDIRNKDKTIDGRVDREERPFVDNINIDKIEAGIIVL
jgi:hypothetical protein